MLAGLAALLAAPPPSAAVTIDWVAIGNPGNAADTPSSNCYAASCGSVSYSYYISKYEVTNAQYAEFLNAKAASDPLGLYNTSMGSNATFGGITRSGSQRQLQLLREDGLRRQARDVRLLLRLAALLELAEQRAGERQTRRRGRTRCWAGRRRRATG